MKKTLMWWHCFLILGAVLVVSSQSFAQYGGGYGGQYGGGYGGMGSRRMGGMDPTMSSSPRSSIPNIAGDMAQKETKFLKDNLSLSKEQLKAVKNLNNEYASQQQDALKDIIGTGGGRPSPDAIKQVQGMMLMLNEEKEDKLKTILTPEQWTLYQSKKEDMQKQIGGFRPPAPKKDSLSKAGAQP